MGICPILLFLNATSTTEIYTLSLHDALPIYAYGAECFDGGCRCAFGSPGLRSSRHVPKIAIRANQTRDRKSTRLNSSHITSSYAVFCLKKKNQRCTPRLRATHNHGRIPEDSR